MKNDLYSYFQLGFNFFTAHEQNSGFCFNVLPPINTTKFPAVV